MTEAELHQPKLRVVSDEAAHRLPAWTYNDADFMALEKHHVFMPAWHLVCHESDVPAIGDYTTFSMMGEIAFVVRGKDGVIRGFHNVCRHRAARLVDGHHGNCGRNIVCPYHAWTYQLDGRLSGVPYLDQYENFDAVVQQRNDALDAIALTGNVQPALGREFLPFLRNQRDVIRFDRERDLRHGVVRRHFQVEFGAGDFTQEAEVPVLDVPAVFAQVDDQSICSGQLDEDGRCQGIRVVPSPCLPQRCDMIDIDAKPGH